MKFRKLEDGEVDEMYGRAKAAVEALRYVDARNPELTLGPIENHGEQDAVCSLLNFRACDSLYRWNRDLRKAVPGCELVPISDALTGVIGFKLRMPLHVPEEEQLQQQQRPGFAVSGGRTPPSRDRAMLLLVLLGVLVAGVMRMLS